MIAGRILAGSILLASLATHGEPPNPKIVEAHLKGDVTVGAEEPVPVLANCRTTPQRG